MGQGQSAEQISIQQEITYLEGQQAAGLLSPEEENYLYALKAHLANLQSESVSQVNKTPTGSSWSVFCFPDPVTTTTNGEQNLYDQANNCADDQVAFLMQPAGSSFYGSQPYEPLTTLPPDTVVTENRLRPFTPYLPARPDSAPNDVILEPPKGLSAPDSDAVGYDVHAGQHNSGSGLPSAPVHTLNSKLPPPLEQQERISDGRHRDVASGNQQPQSQPARVSFAASHESAYQFVATQNSTSIIDSPYDVESTNGTDLQPKPAPPSNTEAFNTLMAKRRSSILAAQQQTEALAALIDFEPAERLQTADSFPAQGQFDLLESGLWQQIAVTIPDVNNLLGFGLVLGEYNDAVCAGKVVSRLVVLSLRKIRGGKDSLCKDKLRPGDVVLTVNGRCFTNRDAMGRALANAKGSVVIGIARR